MAAKDYCAGQYDPEAGPLTSSFTHLVDVTPSDTLNLAFLCTGLLNSDDVARKVAVIMGSGVEATIYLKPGIPFPARVWRVKETGTDMFTIPLQAGDCRTPVAAPAEGA